MTRAGTVSFTSSLNLLKTMVLTQVIIYMYGSTLWLYMIYIRMNSHIYDFYN